MGILLSTPLPNPSGITGVMLCYVISLICEFPHDASHHLLTDCGLLLRISLQKFNNTFPDPVIEPGKIILSSRTYDHSTEKAVKAFKPVPLDCLYVILDQT